MYNSKSLFDEAARSTVYSVYSYGALDSLKGILPIIVVEELKKNYFELKKKMRFARARSLIVDQPEGMRRIEWSVTYGIKYNGMSTLETTERKADYLANSNIFCRSCWIEHEQHFSNSKVDDVTVTCNERKNEEIVEGYNILNWAIDYVCSICDECVFEIVWESECLAECTCVWCLWGDPCPYGDAPMDRSYYLIDTSDTESGYESFTDEESI
ncbi:hypothetical protein V9T40_002080 [Parthenolecanium corni]|uniref:Uncharacterized protein n=1 Tax=Parthenolecanium corni TaxID=536013 RepID=A0AAN9TFM2_9HEMI